jgi:metal-responsive CopG/Arc/MetJ family transcriptional regulator
MGRKRMYERDENWKPKIYPRKKQQVSVTIDPEILTILDEFVYINFTNRSHFIYQCLLNNLEFRKFMDKFEEKQA